MRVGAEGARPAPFWATAAEWGLGPPLPSCNVSPRTGVFLLGWTPGTWESQSLAFLYEFGPFLQSVTLTGAQGAELDNSPPTTSVFYILYLKVCTLEQGEAVSGSGDRG